MEIIMKSIIVALTLLTAVASIAAPASAGYKAGSQLQQSTQNGD